MASFEDVVSAVRLVPVRDAHVVIHRMTAHAVGRGNDFPHTVGRAWLAVQGQALASERRTYVALDVTHGLRPST